MSDINDTAPPLAQTGDTQPEVATPPAENLETGNVDPATPDATPASPAAADSDRPSRAQQRIEELAADRQALREYAEYWRDRATAGLKPPAAETPKPAEQAPKFADYETADDWAAAHAAFTERRAEARAETKVSERLERERSEAESTATQTAFMEREREFEKTVQGYRETVSNPNLSKYATPTVAEVITTSDIGPALSFHLAQNPDKLSRIASMKTPAQQGAALGRLEAELKAKSSTPVPQKTRTNAPPPPTPVGNSTPSKSLEDMSIDEYMAHRKTWKR